VQVTSAGPVVTYKRFAGAGLTEENEGEAMAAERRKFITGLSPTRLP
jgi:hypothetical protein